MAKWNVREMDDTSMVVAWFTTDIPSASRTWKCRDNCLGMILSMETDNGRVVYNALEISPKPDIAAIKEPTKGKKVTPEEFAIERNKLMDEMGRKNNQEEISR